MDTRAIPASLKSSVLKETNRQLLRFSFFWSVLPLILLLAAGIYFLRFELRSYVFLIQFLDPHASGLLVRPDQRLDLASELRVSGAGVVEK